MTTNPVNVQHERELFSMYWKPRYWEVFHWIVHPNSSVLCGQMKSCPAHTKQYGLEVADKFQLILTLSLSWSEPGLNCGPKDQSGVPQAVLVAMPYSEVECYYTSVVGVEVWTCNQCISYVSCWSGYTAHTRKPQCI